jgi:phytanoyl-CoA hydroxylase
MELDTIIGQYRDQGYARLGRLLDDERLRLLQERAQELMTGRVSYPGMFFQMDAATGQYKDAPLGLGWQGPSRSYRKLEKLELDERFRAWMSDASVEPLVRALIPGEVVTYRAILFNKSADFSSEIPWHQDGGKLWGLSQEPEVQLWTALDDAPEGGGCLEVIPGTHKEGLATPLGGVVPDDRVEERDAPSRTVPLPVRAGEVILLHNHLWHRSGKTRPGVRRMAFSACYMSAQVRCLRTRRAPRVFFSVFR